MLENDFFYDAVEGLEQVPWDQCHRQLEEVESRIVKGFSINQTNGVNRNITLGIIGIFTTLMAAWYFTSKNTDPVDLTSEQIATTAEPSPEMVSDPLPEIVDSTATGDTLSKPVATPSEQQQTITPVSPSPVKKPQRRATASPKRQDSPTDQTMERHITVGRVVDTKGIPIVDALVTSGEATDTTDKSGYYALKVPPGGNRIKVTHLATSYGVEVHSQQNWEIVLDIANQKVVDYHPINAANRFK